MAGVGNPDLGNPAVDGGKDGEEVDKDRDYLPREAVTNDSNQRAGHLNDGGL